MQENANKYGSSMLPARLFWDKDQCPAGHEGLPHRGFIPQLRASPLLPLFFIIDLKPNSFKHELGGHALV